MADHATVSTLLNQSVPQLLVVTFCQWELFQQVHFIYIILYEDEFLWMDFPLLFKSLFKSFVGKEQTIQKKHELFIW
jgi:hypothetical protein